MQGKFLPFLVDSPTSLADKLPTGATEISRVILIAFLAFDFLGPFDFLKGILDLKEMMDVERWLEARDTIWWEESGSTAVGAVQ